MKLDPRHLVQLSVVVETGSFQAAADQLGITQPALSRNLKLLENRLNAAVFRREGRRSVPTVLGLRLANNGLAIRLAEEHASALASQASAGMAGELRIGATPIISGRFLTDAIAEFVQKNPDCRVEMRTGSGHELHGLFDRGQIDLIFGPQSLDETADSLDFQLLTDDRVGVMCRADHDLVGKENVTPKDLESQAWLAHFRHSLMHQQTEMSLVAAGLKRLKFAFETESIRSVFEIVAKTDLVTAMPRITSAPYLDDKLVFLPFDRPQFHRPIGYVQREERIENTITKRFVDLLKTTIPRPPETAQSPR